MSLIGRASLVVADVIVIIVSWMKTFRHVKEVSRLRLLTHIGTMLLRDGKLDREKDLNPL